MNIAAISARLTDHAAPVAQGPTPSSAAASNPAAASTPGTPAAEQSPAQAAALKKKMELARLERARTDSTNTPLAEGPVGRTINIGA